MPPAAVAPKPTVLSLAEDLAAGRTTSRALIEAALTRIADTAGEGARTFIKVYSDTARAAADAQDRLRAAGYVASPLAGLPVSIKDLFDVAGERTLAGSKALDDMPPAQFDAPVVARLRAAGAILIGRTNMTEFAFSGVGINPHYGTPGNPHDRSLHPRRLLIGRCGLGRRRRGDRGDRHRHRGLGAHPGGAMRHRRLEADANTDFARRCDAAVNDPRTRSDLWPTASPAALSPMR